MRLRASELAQAAFFAEDGAGERERIVQLHTGELKRDTGEMKNRLTNVERDVGELKTGLAVVRAELGMVKWMVSGIGAGMLLLLVRTFWPI